MEGLRTLCGEGGAKTYYMLDIYACVVAQWAQIVFSRVQVVGIG